jgi:hypothetical protein
MVSSGKAQLTKIKIDEQKKLLLQEKNIEIAKKMKAENINDHIIKRVTGLALVTIRYLK